MTPNNEKGHWETGCHSGLGGPLGGGDSSWENQRGDHWENQLGESAGVHALKGSIQQAEPTGQNQQGPPGGTSWENQLEELAGGHSGGPLPAPVRPRCPRYVLAGNMVENPLSLSLLGELQCNFKAAAQAGLAGAHRGYIGTTSLAHRGHNGGHIGGTSGAGALWVVGFFPQDCLSFRSQSDGHTVPGLVQVPLSRGGRTEQVYTDSQRSNRPAVGSAGGRPGQWSDRPDMRSTTCQIGLRSNRPVRFRGWIAAFSSAGQHHSESNLTVQAVPWFRFVGKVLFTMLVVCYL